MRIKGIQYVVDEKGRKKGVIIPYKAFRELMEDFYDLRVKSERRHEPTIGLEQVVEELQNEGKLKLG